MLSYTVIGSNNKAQALEFYDAIVAELGGERAFANERLQFYSNGQGAMLGVGTCLLYTSPSPRDQRGSRMPSSA